MEPIMLTNRTSLLEIKKLDGDGWAGQWHYYARFSFMPDEFFEVSEDTYNELEKHMFDPHKHSFQINITMV